MRLIDADKLLARYKERCAGCKETKNYCEHCCDIADVISDIEDAPSAQPEITEAQVKEYCEKRCLVLLTLDLFQRLKSTQPARKEGSWLNKGGKICCSECGRTNFLSPNFCPECGADMR